MDWTGPAVFTDTVYAHLNSLKNPTIIDTDCMKRFNTELFGPDVADGVAINWKLTTGISWPLLINDVVIYPQHSFREPVKNDGREYYVEHLFSGSWKPT
ncbi:unnamed protein product [Ambrosiozyma monospora]|uniref:Unnamed protein product n=1 Tax=Ambrosiozyma monospora TaxID=43982 RepID=A0ACB5SUC4_AMBMO|nr:unnamed protein product [Ambrosiozyma monospora]